MFTVGSAMTTAVPTGLTDSQEIAMSVTELERVIQTPEQIYAAAESPSTKWAS
ncbi:hypothetical protein GCM10020255_094990 [Rhodococcus baikonurensis]